MNKKQIKEKIEDFEYHNSGLKYINGAYVDVINIKINKKDKVVTADVKLVKQMDGVTERYNDCEYPFKILGLESEEK